MYILLAALLVAFSLGWISQRLGLCLIAGIAAAMDKRPALLIVLLSCGLFSVMLSPLYRPMGIHQPFFSPQVPYSLMIFGGLLFGMGAVLNSSCSVGTLTRLSKGDINKLFTILGWVIGIVLWKMNSPIVLTKLPVQPQSFISYLLACTLTVISILLLIFLKNENRFVGSFVLIGLLTGALYALEPQWTPSLFFYDLSHITSDNYHSVFTYKRFFVFFAILCGMLCFTLYKKTFKYQKLESKLVLISLFAGVLMGIGASMTLGGNDAQLLLVAPILQPQSLIPIASICLGALLTLIVKKYFIQPLNR